MKLEFTGRHMDLTPALKSHVEAHFERIDALFEGKPASAHVIIEVERGRHRSEINVKWRNEVLTATSDDSDMYKSLSMSIDKIEKQARRLKDKIIDKSHKAKKAAVVAPKEASVEPEPNGPQIIIESKYAVKPMTPEEAVLMLNGDKDGFLLFRDAESGGVSLVRKRSDGNYGLIQT